MARQRNRQSPELEVWFTVETEDGNAVSGVDGVFDYGAEDDALAAALRLAGEVGKPLSVVGYTRNILGTYAAVTKVEKVG